jgi:L-lactate dehydrogenase (cytochrome)
VVSSHGGRQLIAPPTPLEVLPTVVDAVGDRAVWSTAECKAAQKNVVAAVALAPRPAWSAGPTSAGLMAGGNAGPAGVDILTGEIHTPCNCSTDSVSRLSPHTCDCVRDHPGAGPFNQL